MGGGFDTGAGDKYGLFVGFVFVFNLVVGFGSLNLSAGMQSSGIVFGAIFLTWICFTAFSCLLYLLEAQATANALIRMRRKESDDYKEVERNGSELVDENSMIQNGSSHGDTYSGGSGGEQGIYGTLGGKPNGSIINGEDMDDEMQNSIVLSTTSSDLPQDLAGLAEKEFALEERVEMSVMAELFMGKIGVFLFYFVLVVYLYGDLAIYASAVPNELASLTGGWWIFASDQVYYVYLAGFVVLIGPLCFFNFQKTMWLQIGTMVFRNVAMGSMIVLSLVWIGTHGVDLSKIEWFNVLGAPKMFGVAIYSFMCHHSAPSLVTPIANKRRLRLMLLGDYLAILAVYVLMAVAAQVAYGGDDEACEDDYPCKIQAIYTQNFLSVDAHYGIAYKKFKPISLFLNLFPVLTLSTNFPLISVTLRNNLLNILYIFHLGGLREALERRHWWPYVRQPLFSLLAIVPPFLIAFATQDVSMLVSFTGSYAGLMIMYVFPMLLLVFSRRTYRRLHQDGGDMREMLLSKHPFGCTWIGHWVVLVVISLWSIAAVAMVTGTFILKYI